jgi:hypothetical protein
LEIFRKLAAADPDNIMAEPDINVVLLKMGAIRLGAGDRDGALAAYEEALQIARHMAKALPDRDVWREEIVTIRSKIDEIKQLPDTPAEH